jgi:ATP/maltotriose-dependent transcriptional regulator MalT
VAWVSCDEGDNDPVVLLSALAVALDRIESVDTTIFWMLASSGAGAALILAERCIVAAGRDDSTLATIKAGGFGASSLTAAELRLLPLLSTHLSFREIGERLYISPHTVKTQAYSIYRKLGVSSRSGAVTRTQELGLGAL